MPFNASTLGLIKFLISESYILGSRKALSTSIASC